MRIVYHLPNDDLLKAQDAAVACEQAGFDGVVALENAHGPIPPLAVAALKGWQVLQQTSEPDPRLRRAGPASKPSSSVACRAFA